MRNVPRIFINEKIQTDVPISIDKQVSHYLNRVMRTTDCLIFNNGDEFNAKLSDDLKYLVPIKKTNHKDPSGDIILYFAPIKKTEELVNMATQMGVLAFQPVITEQTTANYIKWDRIKKIITEASEQSNRNSVPELLSPMKFSDIDMGGLIFADERPTNTNYDKIVKGKKLLIGPEGGFSDSEFDMLDKSGATSISLGKTILRAETAAVAAIAKIS